MSEQTQTQTIAHMAGTIAGGIMAGMTEPTDQPRDYTDTFLRSVAAAAVTLARLIVAEVARGGDYE